MYILKDFVFLLKVFSQENFREALVKWIIKCNQPFTEPEQESFVHMIDSLNPQAKTMSADTIKNDVVSMYESKVEILRQELKVSLFEF